MTDPNWFYSALAQSAAAIVGLIGALLLLKTLTPHGWGIAHDKKQKFGVNSSFKSVTIGFLWY